MSFFTNDFDTRTRGVDVVGSYTHRLGAGRLELTGAFNYNDTEVTSGSLNADPVQKVIFEEGIPKQNVTASARLQRWTSEGRRSRPLLRLLDGLHRQHDW